mmetsp:Transcript_7921/g.26307  ORF Transcript_7921/g.26307 Transcript_7921/m.26307 type:complete len:363 (-) Transcript_7921:360-1448(-)
MAWGSARGPVGFSRKRTPDKDVSRPRVLNQLPEKCVSISALTSHVAAVSISGRVFTWGLSHLCGHEGFESYGRSLPRPVGGFGSEVKVRSVSAGGNHTVALDATGTVFAWGMAEHGQLGLGTTEFQAHPRKLEMAPRIRSVAAGFQHSAAVTASGELFMFGSGEHGELGYGGVNNQLKPRKVKGFAVEAVSLGMSFTLALAPDGKAYAWGDGRNGRLGHDSTWGEVVPRVITSVPGRVVQVEAGLFTSALVLESGALYTFGHPRESLGHGSSNRSGSAAALDSFDVTHPTAVPNLAPLLSVHSGGESPLWSATVAVTRDGAVFTAGGLSVGRGETEPTFLGHNEPAGGVFSRVEGLRCALIE